MARSLRGNRKEQHPEPREGKGTPSSSFSLLSQEAKSKRESDRFTRATWEVGSSPKQEAELLLKMKVQMPRGGKLEGKGKFVRKGEKAEKDYFAGHSWVGKEVHKFVCFSSANQLSAAQTQETEHR